MGTDLDVLVTQRPQLLPLVSALVQVVDVHLLAQDGERRLRRLAHLLVHTLRLKHRTGSRSAQSLHDECRAMKDQHEWVEVQCLSLFQTEYIRELSCHLA